MVVEDLYVVALDLFRRVSTVNADGLNWISPGKLGVVVYPESGPLAPLHHGCNGSVSYVHLRCDMKGLEPKW